MREIRPSGSEGGAGFHPGPYPYHLPSPPRARPGAGGSVEWRQSRHQQSGGESVRVCQLQAVSFHGDDLDSML